MCRDEKGAFKQHVDEVSWVSLSSRTANLTTSGRDELSPLGRRPCDVNVKYLDAKSRDENLSSPVRKHTRSVLPRAGYMQTNRPSQVDTGGTALGAISRMPSRFP